MQPQERLEYESRVRNRQTAVAALAGILVMAGVLLQALGPHAKVNEQTLGLITEHKRIVLDLLGAGSSALGSLALAWTLAYLFEAARAREPRIKPTFIGKLAIGAGVLSGLSAIASAIASAHASSQFVSQGNQTWPQAHALLHKPWIVIPEICVYLAALLMAIALVLVSLNAMRVGLLPRFMGYLGIISGVLTIFPLVPIPIVEVYWLLAVAVLLSGRWPSGVPPAWTSGRAVPWPSSQQIRAERAQAAAARGARGKRAPAPATQPAGAPAPSATTTRSTTSKRKRKRRK